MYMVIIFNNNHFICLESDAKFRKKSHFSNKSFTKLLSQGYISLDSHPNDAIHIWLERSCNIDYVYVIIFNNKNFICLEISANVEKKSHFKTISFTKLLSEGHISLDLHPNDAIHIWLERSFNIDYVYGNNIQ